jgi:Fur family peroxide stress response transcriptional regulator
MIINKKNSDIRFEEMLSRLKELDCRITSQRIFLLRMIAASEGHPGAIQLYENLRALFPTVSLAMVYKTIALLKQQGEVLEIDLHGQSRYDGNKPYPHPHLICTQCNQIIDGDQLPALARIEQQIMETYGFQVSHQNQVFYGVCPDCMAGADLTINRNQKS